MTNLNYCRISVKVYFSVLDNSYFTKTSNAKCPLSQNESYETYALYRDLGRVESHLSAVCDTSKHKDVFCMYRTTKFIFEQHKNNIKNQLIRC